MSKRQLSAREILQDIRSGMDDTTLMGKYHLSSQGLQSVFKKLIAVRVIKQAELDQRTPPHDRTVNLVWKCPACGKSQSREFEECPECGVIADKFLKQQLKKQNRETEEQSERERLRRIRQREIRDYRNRRRDMFKERLSQANRLLSGESSLGHLLPPIILTL